MYLYGSDLELLLERVDGDEELAWLVPTSPGCWNATRTHPEPLLAAHELWHVPSGPLPLLAPRSGPGYAKSDPRSPQYEGGWIDDPWSGWAEQRRGATLSTPYFGPGWPGAYGLHLNLHRVENEGEIGMSSFGWIGKRYEPPDPATERHWRRLGVWVRRNGEKVARGHRRGGSPEIFAFPSALEAIRNGTPCAVNPLPPWPWQFVDGPDEFAPVTEEVRAAWQRLAARTG